jgi:Ca2+-binding EF-hand superfamily protein
MTLTRKVILTAFAVSAMFALAQTAPPPPADAKQNEKNVAAGEVEAKRLLLLMDRDSNGKVSHKEFIAFMEEEFQKLDVNKDGELDVAELTRSRLTPHGGRQR